jgi:integrase
MSLANLPEEVEITMGRTPLKVGSYGKVHYRRLDPHAWQARCRFRDDDGMTRQVSAKGKTKRDAHSALITKLIERGVNLLFVEGLEPNSRFADAATLWLAQIEQTQSGTTHQSYRQWLHGRVLPDIGGLRLRELRVGYLDAYFTRLRIQYGYKPNTLRMIRKVIRGPMNLAVQHEAIAVNPIKNINPIVGQPKQARALTPEERDRLRRWLEDVSDNPGERKAQETARRRDLPDVVQIMLGTGLRIGELMALRWCDLNLDGVPLIVNGEPMVVCTATVRGNVIRVRGKGIVFHEGKTPSALRVIPLPPFVVKALQSRRERLGDLGHGEIPVFFTITSKGITWGDPGKVTGWVREIRQWVGLDWMTTHVWRKTAATILDEAGLSARAIADQMGHAQISMTQNVYLGRGGMTPAAATVLQTAWGDD